MRAPGSSHALGLVGMLLALLLAGAGPAAAQALRSTAPPARDSTATPAVQDSSGAQRAVPVVRDSSAAPLVRDTTAMRAVPDSSGARQAVPMARGSTGAGPPPPVGGAGAEAPGPLGGGAPDAPLNISADNVSGSHEPEGDVVMLNGNVRVIRGRSVLTADAGRYLRAQGMLFMDGRVKMVDSTTTVTCDHAAYDENKDQLTLQGDVVITDRDAVLKAPAGVYDRRRGRADLFGGVDAADKTQRLLCDQAVYYRDSMVVQARGNVRGMDPENKLELNAHAVDYDRNTHEAVATGDPVLRSRDDDGRESRLRAITLRVNTETRLAEAIDSVRVDRDTLQARGDYALFDDQANRGWLLGKPRAWDDQITVVGDTLEFWTEQRKLKRVVVRNHAVMDYRGSRPNTLGESSLLTGRQVDVFFTGNQIDSLVAVDGAHDEYQAVPRAGKTPEHNDAKGDTITLYFKNRKIDRARVQGRASGEYRLAVAPGDTAAARQEVVQYEGKRIDFIVPSSHIVLDESAHLVYRELELHSRRVEFDIEKQTLVADGRPELVDRGDKVTGGLMTYDLESRTGTIYRATTAYEKGLYHGERIRKSAENQLDVMNGSYTTCSLAQPHYHFQARWMKIYLKDKLVAKPIVFYLENVPVFALPFYVFPIKPGRHSGFLFPQFEFGFSNRAGQFIRNAGYYWAPNDYMDYTFSGDYYQAEPSWVMRGEGVYKLLYVLDGNFHGTYARNENTKREDWDFTANHSQEITPRTRVAAQASFVSSRDFSRSNLYGNTLAQRLNRFLTSNLSVSHTADWASFSAALDRRQDLDADVSIEDPDGLGPLQGPGPGTGASLPSLTESTPSLAVTFPTRTIGSLGLLKGTPLAAALKSLYFSLNGQFLSQRQRTGFVSHYSYFTRDSVLDSTTVIDHRDQTRRALATSTALTDSRRLFGWLNLAPSVSANGAVFDFDEQGHRLVPTGTWNSAVSTSATFYGTFRPRIGPIEGVRHVLFPRASLSYSPEFKSLTFVDSSGVRRDRFHGFGGIGVSGFKSAFLNFGLDQRLQVKLRRRGQVTRLDNLLSLSTSSSFDFLYKERHEKRGLTPLVSILRLQPPGLLSADMSWTTDLYSPRPVRNLTANLGMNLASGARASSSPQLPAESVNPDEAFREEWSLGLAYSYAGGYSFGTLWKSAQTANAVLHYKLTPAWLLDYSASYDVTNHALVTQRFGLGRDLHCWTITFTRTFVAGGEAEYYFRLGIKEQREIYIERGTRIGSLGGIQ